METMEMKSTLYYLIRFLHSPPKKTGALQLYMPFLFGTVGQ